jgi:hypothetical protein
MPPFDPAMQIGVAFASACAWSLDRIIAASRRR